MGGNSAEWDRAITVGVYAFERALSQGAGHEVAMDVALARVRAFVHDADDYEVRATLAFKLAQQAARIRRTRRDMKAGDATNLVAVPEGG